MNNSQINIWETEDGLISSQFFVIVRGNMVDHQIILLIHPYKRLKPCWFNMHRELSFSLANKKLFLFAL